MLVVRHKTTEVQCFHSKNSISIYLTTTTKVELKRQRQKLNNPSILNLETNLNVELEKVSQWLYANKLSLNIE